MYTIILVVHTIIVVFLILMVLIQRSDSDGMGGLGGGGGNQFLTGRSQANLMTRTTAFLAGAFFITSLTLAIMGSRMGNSSLVDSAVVPAVELPPVKTDTKTDAKAVVKKAAEPKAPAAPAVPKPE